MKISRHTTGAFSLVEVTLSLGVISFCLLALFGLLPIGMRSNQQAVEQTAANGILSSVVADLRATAALSGTTQNFLIVIPPNPTTSGSSRLYFTGDGQVSTLDKSRYLLTVTFLANGVQTGTSRAATLVNLQVSWPAAVDPAVAQPNGKVQTFVAMDRN